MSSRQRFSGPTSAAGTSRSTALILAAPSGDSAPSGQSIICLNPTIMTGRDSEGYSVRGESYQYTFHHGGPTLTEEEYRKAIAAAESVIEPRIHKYMEEHPDTSESFTSSLDDSQRSNHHVMTKWDRIVDESCADLIGMPLASGFVFAMGSPEIRDAPGGRLSN